MPTAFKEWSLVCDALGSGRQSIILRKGGIAEGRDGFQFKHPEFFLFPTHFHEQAKHLRLPHDTEVPDIADGEREHITVEYFAELVETRVITDWDEACALEPLHLWTRDTVRERFDYQLPRHQPRAGAGIAPVPAVELPQRETLRRLPLVGGDTGAAARCLRRARASAWRCRVRAACGQALHGKG